jgi:PAS domain S-box-containing protein
VTIGPESGEELRNLYESSRLPAVFLDGGCRVRSFSSEFGRLFNLGDRDRWRMFWEAAPEFRPELGWAQRLETAMTTGLRCEAPLELIRTGQTFLVAATGYRTNAGKLDGAVLTFTDVTEVKLARRDHSQLAAIVHSSDEAIVSLDLEGIVQSWNPGAERLFGWSGEEILGRPVSVLVPPEKAAEQADILLRLRRGDRVPSTDTLRLRKDGSVLEVAVTLSPIVGIAGSVVGSALVARDIAERKRAQRDLEERVRERSAELVEINQQLEAFVYSIAHDLRAPLRTMSSFAELLLEEFGATLDPVARDYSERIARGAENMDRLLIDLLSYGRVARAQLELKPVPLDEAWQFALTQHEDQIRTSAARIRASEALPKVLAHEATLGQMLAHLLGNALKFTAAGAAPDVTVSVERRGERVRVWIADQGIGIPSQYHDRIFKMFERLRPREYGGTGVGLAIVQKGAERMGGTAGVESEEGRGSRFWLELVPA